ncbi:hypothetical protein [Candidatus Villigracilis affinis]|uniref:hypothetical protein n=1 Tax=Candidatus Villigracilis affinis TaxID=3140682 RepID=UPI001DC9AC45|nr:hypothetical protein [Anaerolineales bacterium]
MIRLKLKIAAIRFLKSEIGSQHERIGICRATKTGRLKKEHIQGNCQCHNGKGNQPHEGNFFIHATILQSRVYRPAMLISKIGEFFQ